MLAVQAEVVDQVGAGDQADELFAVQHDGHPVAVEQGDQGVQRLADLNRVQITGHY